MSFLGDGFYTGVGSHVYEDMIKKWEQDNWNVFHKWDLNKLKEPRPMQESDIVKHATTRDGVKVVCIPREKWDGTYPAFILTDRVDLSIISWESYKREMGPTQAAGKHYTHVWLTEDRIVKPKPKLSEAIRTYTAQDGSEIAIFPREKWDGQWPARFFSKNIVNHPSFYLYSWNEEPGYWSKDCPDATQINTPGADLIAIPASRCVDDSPLALGRTYKYGILWTLPDGLKAERQLNPGDGYKDQQGAMYFHHGDGVWDKENNSDIKQTIWTMPKNPDGSERSVRPADGETWGGGDNVFWKWYKKERQWMVWKDDSRVSLVRQILATDPRRLPDGLLAERDPEANDGYISDPKGKEPQHWFCDGLRWIAVTHVASTIKAKTGLYKYAEDPAPGKMEIPLPKSEAARIVRDGGHLKTLEEPGKHGEKVWRRGDDGVWREGLAHLANKMEATKAKSSLLKDEKTNSLIDSEGWSICVRVGLRQREEARKLSCQGDHPLDLEEHESPTQAGSSMHELVKDLFGG